MFKRKYGKRRPFKKFKKTFKKVSRRSRKASTKLLKSIGQVEKKFCYHAITNFAPQAITKADAVSFHGIITAMWPANGNTVNTRLGNKIFIRYLTIHCSIAESTTNYFQAPIRQIIVKSKGLLPVNNGYFDSNLDGIQGTLVCSPHNNMPKIYKSKIIKTWKANTNSGDTTYYLNNINSCRWTSWKTTIRVMKSYQVGTTMPLNHADFFIQWLVPHSTDALIKIGTPTVNFSCRMTFTDA